jgi:2-amino-4-hydroxy-6-hydroxymethyldihydropteridine diphosphokinase
MGLEDQTDFMNGALLMVTELDLKKLRFQLKRIEHDLGRPSGSLKYGPRTIDLDILVWNGTVVEDDFYERDFIRKSVLELSPDVKYSKGFSENAL